jgi:dienelactone hydrolase
MASRQWLRGLQPMDTIVSRSVAVLCVAAALLVATIASGQTAAPRDNTVVIRGQKQELHRHPPTATPLNKKVLFVPGVGGWRGWAITIAQTMASWGYDVQGWDTKVYLDGFTGKAPLTEADVMSDFRELADWMTNRSGERVSLVGWSEGAGMGVLGAAGERNKSVFEGFVGFGLGDENAIAWHWADNLLSLATKPNEPTFRASDYMARIAPVPFFMIQSTHDQYTPLDEAKRLFGLARDPKRFALIEGRNHRFDGNQDEFFRTLREGLRWINQTH